LAADLNEIFFDLFELGLHDKGFDFFHGMFLS